MTIETKKWIVDYNHNDGRKGSIAVMTEIRKSEAFEYGNGKSGMLTVDNFKQCYDLHYCKENDLHKVMLEDYFGKRLVKATEIIE